MSPFSLSFLQHARHSSRLGRLLCRGAVALLGTLSERQGLAGAGNYAITECRNWLCSECEFCCFCLACVVLRESGTILYCPRHAYASCRPTCPQGLFSLVGTTQKRACPFGFFIAFLVLHLYYNGGKQMFARVHLCEENLWMVRIVCPFFTKFALGGP